MDIMSWRTSSGLRAWVIQRFTAVYLLAFTVYSTVAIFLSDLSDYTHWKGWVASPLNNNAIALFTLALLLHAWVGIRDVVMDYVKPFALRFALLVAVAMLLIAMSLWMLRILTSIAVV
jgi:succinate dehydrogenase / fumarate reductase membrane anchor subunit